jgi:hypothetical protein
MAVPLEFVVKANAGQFKAEMAQVKAIAAGMSKGGGAGGALGGVSAGGGHSGMIRESMVLLREIGRGNWTRVPGSLSLMLQYMGAFSKILKVTHSDLAQHALDLEKEAQAMAKAAVAESVRNGTSKLQQAAAVAMAAAEKARAAGTADASALTIIAKQREAAAYAEAAAIEGAATTTVLGPIGWLIAAIVALGAAIYFTVNHFHKLAVQQLNLAEAMGGLNTQAERQTKQLDDMASAARNLAVEIANVHKHEKSLSEISDEAVESLKRNAQAKAELAKEDKQIRLDEIELAEKMHRISAQTATRQRTEVEIQALKNEMVIKQDALVEQQNQRLEDYAAAKKADAAATADYQEKEKTATAAGPAGAGNMAELEAATRQRDFLAKHVSAIEKMQRERSLPGIDNGIERLAAKTVGMPYENTPYMNASVEVDGQAMPKAKLKDVQADLESAQQLVADLKAGMSDVVVSAVAAKARMESAEQSKLRLGTEVDKGSQGITDAASNDQKLLDKKAKDLALKQSAKLYEEGQQGVTKGYSLNSQQKVGAYAATPPDFKRLVDAAIRTAQNTDNLRGKSFNPVGQVPMQVGPGGHH